MSGGRWNYDQNRVEALGEQLQEEGNPVLRAMGCHLVSIAREIKDADWFLSCDTSHYDFGKMAALLPDAAFKSAALAMIEDATAKLEGARSLIVGTPTPPTKEPSDG